MSALKDMADAIAEFEAPATLLAPGQPDKATDRFEMWMFTQGAWAACPHCAAPLFPGVVHRCEP